MPKRKFKRASKMKANVIQYIIVGVLSIPLLALIGFNAERNWGWSDALTIFVMCAIILALWLIWVGIRSLIRRRSERFIQEKREMKGKR